MTTLKAKEVEDTVVLDIRVDKTNDDRRTEREVNAMLRGLTEYIRQCEGLSRVKFAWKYILFPEHYLGQEAHHSDDAKI